MDIGSINKDTLELKIAEKEFELHELNGSLKKIDIEGKRIMAKLRNFEESKKKINETIIEVKDNIKNLEELYNKDGII